MVDEHSVVACQMSVSTSNSADTEYIDNVVLKDELSQSIAVLQEPQLLLSPSNSKKLFGDIARYFSSNGTEHNQISSPSLPLIDNTNRIFELVLDI